MSSAETAIKEPNPNEQSNVIVAKLSGLKVAEFSGFVTIFALICGLAYDASFFYSFDPQLISLLSTHDHINSAVSFLPFTLSYLFITNFVSSLLSGKGKHNLKIIISHYFLRWIPSVHTKIVVKNTVQLAAIDVVSDLKEEFKAKHPEEHAKAELDEKSNLIVKLTISILTIAAVVYTMYHFVRPPWSAFTVILATILVELIIFFHALVFSKQNFSGDLIITIMFIPIVLCMSSLAGFSEAVKLVNSREKPAFVFIKDKPDNTMLLARIIDSGLVLYSKSNNHMIYFSWRDVDRLEVRRRSW